MAFLSAAPDRPRRADRPGASRPARGGIAVLPRPGARPPRRAARCSRLEYSAYGPMAEAECARIVAEAEARWPVRVALEHRIGALEIGDTAVAIAAAGAHRDEAFAACRFVIEEVKRRVPDLEEGVLRGRQPCGWVPSRSAGGTRGRGAPAMIATTRSLGPVRPVRPAAPQPPHLRHRPLQSPVPLLHAGGGVRVAAARARFSPSRRSTASPGSSPALGVTKVRLTGGEPLLRHDLPDAGRAAVARTTRSPISR